jgi:23S rRNA (uracil1939-C5)-methyltransferase
MARHRKKKLPTEPVQLSIENIGHDGRGIARDNGKAQFVEGALPGEKVLAQFTDRRSKFDELRTLEVLEASADRITPACPKADVCGGCSLQHMNPEAQILLKQKVLEEQFQHFGKLAVSPDVWQPPMTSPTQHYRRKARLGVRYVSKRDEVLVGFREKRNHFITDVLCCPVLDERVEQLLPELRGLIHGLSISRSLPQIEVAAGDEDVALVFRHMAPLTDADHQSLVEFGKKHRISVYLQPKGPDTVHMIWPTLGKERLTYRLEDYDLTLSFHPMDFTQVNADINRRMVARAIDWLDLTPQDRVLDLFCGLGNFTLPLARKAGYVVGVEGDDSMVVRGRENAAANGLDNVTFYGADLQADFTQAAWAQEGFDKILIDPPRSGAMEVVNTLSRFGAKKLVYVSCNPATLARDTGVLVGNGYKLIKTGVMDMFPHTTHVESIALFELA